MLATVTLALTLALQILNPPLPNGEIWDNQTILSTGQSITLTWEIDSGSIPYIDSFRMYRTVGVDGQKTYTTLASGVREYTFFMPSNKVQEYRFKIYAVHVDGTMSPASNEYLVTRK